MIHQLVTRIARAARGAGPLAAALLVAAGTTGATAAHAAPAALGGDGELYRLLTGPYGEVLPEQGLADPEAPALALEITRPDGVERLLVPGTDGDEIEDSASLVYEDGSRTLFVLWQSTFNVIHSRLHLAGLGDGGWTDVIEISGSPFGEKSAPQLAVTRDAFVIEQPNGALGTHQRTIVHLLWWEESGGQPEVRYAPIVFVDGNYVGWNPVYRLDQLLPDDAGFPSDAAAALAAAPRLQPGDDPRSVVVAFVHGHTGRMVSATIEVLPGEIGFLADSVRAQVIDLGLDLLPGSLEALPGAARAQIVDLGRRLRLHPGVATFFANAVAQSLSEGIIGGLGGGELLALADGARAQIVDLGARLDGRGFERGSAAAASTVVEIAGGTEPSSLLRLEPVANRPAPAVERAGEPMVFVSADAEHLLVAWPQETGAELELRYRETEDGGWSATHSLSLGDGMSLEEAHKVLARRVREKR